ncbi:MAG: hypothetical protein AB7F40_07775 [Victivallaceae bacterium]|nr:hypothetical protein [Victivallaceae bacterium]
MKRKWGDFMGKLAMVGGLLTAYAVGATESTRWYVSTVGGNQDG